MTHANGLSMDALDVAWKVFQFGWPLVGGALASVVMLRRRERITWEESAKGHLAKLRHEAVAKCLAGLGELYETHGAYEEYCETEEDKKKQEAQRLASAAEPLRTIAAHEFMLPPELRREVHKLLRWVHPHGLRDSEKEADALCAVVDRYLPPIERQSREAEPAAK